MSANSSSNRQVSHILLMQTRSSRSAHPWFFPIMGGVAALAVAIGFGRTYVVPMSRGTFAAPLWIHVHGAFAFAWILLFVAQPVLVRAHKVHWHRRVGLLGLPIAIGVALTMVPAGVYQARHEAASGLGLTGVSSLIGVLTAAVMFLGLVSAGIAMRRNREAHARWLLLATLLVLWPAWFRFRHYFPGVPRPEIWFGTVLPYVWILVAMLRDRLTRGAVHPVLLWGGSALILEQSLELLAFDTPVWRATAQMIYAWLAA